MGGSPFVPGGIVGRTEDGGRSWRYRTGLAKGGPSASLNAVHAFDRLRAVVAGDGGVLRTSDSGETWEPAHHLTGTSRYLFGVDFLGEQEGWAAGPAGLIATHDGGRTWMRIGEGAFGGGMFAARTIRFTDPRSGWLAGQGGNLWQTRDGGASWARVPLPQPSPPPGSPPYLFGMTWPNASEGWVVGEFGTVLHTSDGGDSWSLRDAGTREAFFTAIQFVGDSGWIVGFFPEKARSAVWRSRDGGTTWSVEARLEGEELRALQMLDAGTGWAVGDRVRTQPQRMLRLARP